MPTKPKKTKKREAQDITIINLRAANKRIKALEDRVSAIEREILLHYSQIAHQVTAVPAVINGRKKQPARRGRK